MKRKLGSFRREKRRRPKDKRMTTNTEGLDQQVAALLEMRDEDIDTTDIPEVKDWSNAVVGKFYRPVKEPITIRLDADLVAQLKAEGSGYQTRINALLRKVMLPISTPSDAPGSNERAALATLPRSLPTSPTFRFRFRCLEKRHELAKCTQLAEVIKKRGSVFARAS